MAVNRVAYPITTIELCAGVGWLSEGVRAGLEYLGLQHRTACYVEWDSYASAVLLARMEEASLEPAPVWCGDLAGFDGKPFRGAVDGIIAGFPCQPFSTAGSRRGHEDERNIWPDILRCIREVEPGFVFLENVPGLASTPTIHHRPDLLAWFSAIDAAIVDEASPRRRWKLRCHRERLYRRLLREQGVPAIAYVAATLEQLDYVVEDPLFVTAESVGASHRRERVFLLAHKPESRSRLLSESGRRIDSADADRSGEELDNTERPDARHRTVEGSPAGQRRGRPAIAGEPMAVTGSVRGRISQPGRGPDRGTAAGGTGCAVGDSNESGSQGRIVGGCGRADERIAGTSGYPLFAPGPGLGLSGVVDDIRELFGRDPETAWRRFEAERRNTERWIDILEVAPHLCPKIKPGVHGIFNGQQLVVDESRADQLRCAGNGVVQSQASAAFVHLVRRAGLNP